LNEVTIGLDVHLPAVLALSARNVALGATLDGDNSAAVATLAHRSALQTSPMRMIATISAAP